jgi:hypothetical protein
MKDALKILKDRCDRNPILKECYVKEKRKMVNFYRLRALARWFVHNMVYQMR